MISGLYIVWQIRFKVSTGIALFVRRIKERGTPCDKKQGYKCQKFDRGSRYVKSVFHIKALNYKQVYYGY
jgi:hypothetical protein